MPHCLARSIGRRSIVAVVAAMALGFALPARSQTPDGTPLQLSEHIRVAMGSAPAGLKRVAISTFFVQFVRDLGIERDAGSFGMFQGQSATYFTQVRGADPLALQKVADALYDALVEDLKAAGLEVVAQADLDANADYQALRAAGKATPLTESLEHGARRDKHMAVNTFVSAKGLPFIARNVLDNKWLPGQAFPGEGYAGMTMVLGPGKVAQALKAGMLNLRLTVALVEQKGKGWGGVSARPDFVLNRWVKTAEANWQFETDPYARWVADGTQFMLSNGDGGLNPNPYVVALKQAVPIVGLEIKGTKGEGGNARGSGLLGAIGRAATGGAATGADLYIDVNADNLAERLIADGRPVMKLFAAALSSPK
jgi:hypothetical protein